MSSRKWSEFQLIRRDHTIQRKQVEKERDDVREELALLKDAAASCGTADLDQKLQGGGGDDLGGQGSEKDDDGSAKKLEEKEREISRLMAEVERKAVVDTEREREREETDREKWTLQAAVVKVSEFECASLRVCACECCISWGERRCRAS